MWSPPFRRSLVILALSLPSVLNFSPPRAQAAGAIFTSQIGHVAADQKVAVLAVPQGTGVQQFFRVLDGTTNAEVYTSAAADVLPYPGGWIGNDVTGDTYLLDFTSAALPAGTYVVESNGARSLPFKVGPGVYDVSRFRPLEFFRIQLADAPVSWQSLDGSIGGHGPDHLDDARQATRRDKGGGDNALIQQDYLPLPGGHLNVSGGWSDAGDYNKYMGNTPWAAYLLLLTFEEYGTYWSPVDENHNGQGDLLELVQPAIEWMLKMQHFDGAMYERVFSGYKALFDGRPDLETDNVSGTSDDRPLDTDRYADITAKSAYALAAAYRVFRDPRYLNAAIQAWNWAYNNQSKVKPKVYGGGLYFGDVEIGLTLGALEIHRAQAAAGQAPDPKYLVYATTHIQNHLAAGDWINPSSWDFQQSYALMRYYDLASDFDKGRIVSQLQARWDAAIQSQGRNAYRMDDEWLYGDFGQNESSTSGAGDALWVYSKTNNSKYYDYAVNQLAWVFGRNPFGESWLASAGVSEYTRAPHWRATAKHAIEGVVVPGATDRNANGIPDYTDTGDWFYSEPTINQQAMFIRVMTSLYFASGGVVNSPTDPPPTLAITRPSDGSNVSGLITIEANASDAGGVASVQYRVDNGPAAPMLLMTGTANSGVWQADLNTTQLSDGQHQITVAATDTVGQQSSRLITINVVNGAQSSLHVERIDVTLNHKGGSPKGQGKVDVYIYDAFGRPVSGATVSGHWESAAADTFTVTTDATGKATDYSNSANWISGITFRCVVDGVSKAGWLYDPSANKQTSGSATVLERHGFQNNSSRCCGFLSR